MRKFPTNRSMDVLSAKRCLENFLRAQNKILALIARDAPLIDVFTEITRQLEELHPNVTCGIMTSVDNHALHVAPSLPADLHIAMNEMQFTQRIPNYHNEVFITDFAKSPIWAKLLPVLASHQFTAAWSKPLLASNGAPVGVLGFLFKGNIVKREDRIELYDAYARLAALVIELKQSQREIEESDQRYKSLFDNNMDAIYQFDLQGRFVTVNNAFEATFGYTHSELLGMHYLEVVVPEDGERAALAFESLKRGQMVRMELGVVHKNGKRLVVQVIDIPIQVRGEIVGIFGVAKDITSLRYSQDLLAHQKRVLEMIAKGCSLEATLYELTSIVECMAPGSMCSVFFINDDNETMRYVTGNQRLKGYVDDIGSIILGITPGVVGTAPAINKVVIVEDIETDPLYENYRHISLRHGLRACFATPIVSSSGKVLGTFGLYFGVARRPSKEELELLETVASLAGLAVERKQADDNIKYLAHHDALTGLPNRTLFYEHVINALKHASEENYQFAVMFLDLDRFKSFNDSMGHHFGDRLLKIVAHRITNCLSSEYVLARMGGDEFTILLPRISSADVAKTLACRIVKSFDVPIDLDGNEFRLTTSIGIAVFPDDGDNPESLMRMADVAMYCSKANGINTYRFYAGSMNETFYERLMLESALRRALDNGEFMLWYQPRVDTKSKAVTSVEALLRWNKPGDGVVQPAEFISIAEETGLIVSIGKWVFYEVCRQIKAWESSGKIPVRIALNVSPRQFQEPDFMNVLRDALEETQVNPEWLEIEVTESGLIENEIEVLDILHELKRLGIETSIDDFGIGYSSLNRLKSMPVDALKIDRSFIHDMHRDDAAITRVIIVLAHNLHLKVIAEGVETEEQFNCLREFGCDEIQGYLITPPIPINEFEKEFMENHDAIPDRGAAQGPKLSDIMN